MKKHFKALLGIIAAAVVALSVAGCSVNVNINQSGDGVSSGYTGSVDVSVSNLPAYSGKPYIVVNNNKPYFTDKEIKQAKKSFEYYSPLDSLGRCGPATASVSPETQPTEKRGNISKVKPTGWHSVTYKATNGQSLYNRSHLIAYCLSGENANERNLITGTQYMNQRTMTQFENMVDDYIDETGNHVLYRSTPVFEGNNLVANGVLLEAYSIEDDGEGICFNVYLYNVQPGIIIDYKNGDSREE